MKRQAPRIQGFGDAVAALDQIQARFGRAHAPTLLGAGGCVRDMTAFTGADRTWRDAFDWACCIPTHDPRSRLVVLLSAVEPARR